MRDSTISRNETFTLFFISMGLSTLADTKLVRNMPSATASAFCQPIVRSASKAGATSRIFGANEVAFGHHVSGRGTGQILFKVLCPVAIQAYSQSGDPIQRAMDFANVDTIGVERNRRLLHQGLEEVVAEGGRSLPRNPQHPLALGSFGAEAFVRTIFSHKGTHSSVAGRQVRLTRTSDVPTVPIASEFVCLAVAFTAPVDYM
jgi:hypothetical protein